MDLGKLKGRYVQEGLLHVQTVGIVQEIADSGKYGLFTYFQ